MRHEEAEASYRRGMQLGDLGRFEEAVQALREAAALLPDYLEAHRNLGLALLELGRPAEAEPCLRQALALAPRSAALHVDLADALASLARWPEAETGYRQALSIDTKLVAAHNGVGNALRERGELKPAEASYRRALKLAPDSARSHANLALALFEQGHVAEAERSYRRAIALEPGYAVAHAGLAQVLLRAARLAESVAASRRALELNPQFMAAHSNLIFALDLLETSDTRSQQDERRRWYLQHAEKFARDARPHENVPDPLRRLRVGYVSADFRRHSAYSVFSPVIRRHDAAGFEVFCYSGVTREDEETARLRSTAHEWRSSVGISDDALAAQIRHDGIDVLVDLSGHSAGHRLLVFARKPAPVQITAWGHATGTGMKTMDYFFSDRVMVPPEERALYAEEIVDLPCALCYEPPEYLPPLSSLPASRGEPFTFGCVNRLEKIGERAITLWGRILEQSPEARLLVKDKLLGDAQVRQRFLGRLRALGGIASERVELVGWSSHAEHLKVFERIDIGLDPFPQGGGVSTGEALCMGVPVVALLGSTIARRVTASMLSSMQMPDWIGRDEDHYARIALRMKGDLGALAALRSGLRERLLRSPYGDAERYARAVETAYRQAWQRWCNRP